MRKLEYYVSQFGRLGPVEFAAQYGRPAFVAKGIAGEVQDESSGKKGTLKMSISNLMVSESLTDRVWLVTKSDSTEPGVTGGRGSDNDIVIPEYTISNRHFCIHFEPFRLVLMDLDSTNGTFVGDKRLVPFQRAPLRNEAVVRFGRYQFDFLTRAGFLACVEAAARPSR